jgi:nuclear receptor subfamily 1 group D protein 3
MGISSVMLQACPLNPNPQPLTGQQELLQDFSKRFSPAIRGVVEFAKRIPGFALLPQDDQVTLLKAGVFEVLLVRLACMFDAQVSTPCVGCSPQIILSCYKVV